MNQLNFAPVPFRGATLYLIEHNNEPYIPMRPIVEGMGLDWAGQYTKLKGRFTATVEEVTTVAEDGKQREMTCLPLRKLASWLMTISVNKVKPEIRETIIAYQNECDDVLWQYWTTGMAIKPGVTPPPVPQDRFLEMRVKEFGKGNIAAAELLKSRYGLKLDIETQRSGNATKKMNGRQQAIAHGQRLAEQVQDK